MADKGALLFPSINAYDCVTRSKFDNVYELVCDGTLDELCNRFIDGEIELHKFTIIMEDHYCAPDANGTL